MKKYISRIMLTFMAFAMAAGTQAQAMDCFAYCHGGGGASAGEFADCYNGLGCGS